MRITQGHERVRVGKQGKLGFGALGHRAPFARFGQVKSTTLPSPLSQFQEFWLAIVLLRLDHFL